MAINTNGNLADILIINNDSKAPALWDGSSIYAALVNCGYETTRIKVSLFLCRQLKPSHSH